MTVIQKDNEFYHDEHDCTVKISNDNTKHLKVITITLRVDLTQGKSLEDVIDTVNGAFNKANGNGEVKED